MTQLHFLPAAEKRKFDLPPVFTHKQRPAYFIVTDDIRRTLSALRSDTNKIGFLLQLGYFKHSGKFFEKHAFRQRDIKYLKKQFHIAETIDLAQYSPSRMAQHQFRIRELLGWTAFDANSGTQIARHVQIQAEQQIKPERIFAAAVDLCWQQRIEIPTHHQLANVITDSFNIVESAWLEQLLNGLEPSDCEVLDTLLESVDGLPALLGEIKTISQSLQVKEIKKSVDSCLIFGKYGAQFESAYTLLNLPEKATEYYATWLKKATMAQLKQFPSRWKRYLHLLSFIKHQYSLRQDVLMDILLKSTQSSINAAINAEDRSDLQKRAEQKDAIRVVTKAHKSAQRLLDEITHITRNENLTASERIAKIEQLLSDHEALQSDQAQEQLQQSELFLAQQTDTTKIYDELENKSVSLQLRASPTLKALVFDAPSSEADLLAAVQYFQDTDGLLGKTAPLDFLSPKEQALFPEGETFRISLYKILLFKSVAAAVRAGKLNLQHSYRYRAIQNYLIPSEQWSSERDHLLAMAGLEKFADGAAVLAELKGTLDASYRKVNNRILTDENEYLSFDKKGTAKVRTPGTAFSEDGYVGQTLEENGIVSVLQVLREVSQSCNFISCFKHLSPKHHKLKPSAETVLAGILGKGCNIGIHKLSQISQGINQSTLKSTVNWCFTLKNIQAANTQLLQVMDKLVLSSAFQEVPGQLHTSSDGRKVQVAVDSLHASHSFKYFGKDKGVTLYTFIDERHALFHSTVISASEREAAYVIDGLMQNEVIKSDIHSTDTHGYTESIFAATHLIDTAFAPRLKKVGKQTLSSFSSRGTHQRRGDVVLPGHTINQKLILSHWDDILRFMATIKLRHSSASQLFKRLSSYAHDHPLYKALKEFGRVIKTRFILTYLDNLELRQRIEKQLNKIELANRFSRAVFFANNQEFQEGNLEEQEIATACKVLIQNAIVLWNTLYLSQQLSNASNAEEHEGMLNAITSGSLLTWQHVNMQGEYDFRRVAANEESFDMDKILALRLA
jgi:TnpA family transposase